jgi:5-formyltetrahydrofolate cyclo-ligase
MLKAELRKIYKQKRALLSTLEYEKSNDLILIQFQQLELPFLHEVLSFFPLEDMQEPDTFLITRYLRFQNPQLDVAYPRIEADGSMKAIVAQEDSEFINNKYDIPELQEGKIMQPQAIDLVLVPMLTCNYKGHRVGYGKGYYDKYLMHCRADCLKVGLSFFDPEATISDINNFDIPLTHCITTDSIYEF